MKALSLVDASPSASTTSPINQFAALIFYCRYYLLLSPQLVGELVAALVAVLGEVTEPRDLEYLQELLGLVELKRDVDIVDIPR